MVTSSEVLDALNSPKTAVNRGRLMHQLERAKREGHPAEQVAFLQAMIDRPATPSASYQHPTLTVKPSTKDDVSLSASDIAWLDRLPRDPAKVSQQDACTLAALSAHVSAMKHESDARLIAAVWEPVKQIHDRKSAEVALGNAKRPLAPMPVETRTALEAALREEFPGLGDDSIRAEATSRLDRVVDAQRGSHERELQHARSEWEQVSEGQADYDSVQPVADSGPLWPGLGQDLRMHAESAAQTSQATTQQSSSAFSI